MAKFSHRLVIMSLSSDLSTYRAAAYAALASADYATAKSNALAAYAIVAMSPTTSQVDQLRMEWSPDQIRELIKLCDAQLASAAGIQLTKVEYVATTDD